MSHSALTAEFPVVVIGAGPAGLNAANSLAFEGVKPLVVEPGAPGGQAATSHFIENVPGFPDGISGPELTTRLILQGLRDGVQYLSPFRASRLEYDPVSCCFTLIGDDHERITCRAVIIATGVQNRLLKVINASLYFNRGIFYGSPAQTRALWEGKTIGVVGGGNAAAQAAMFLAACAGTQVQLLVRGTTLGDSMSARVIDHLDHLQNVNIMLQTEIVEIVGDKELVLTGVKAKSPKGVVDVAMSAMHVHIGSRPRTAWLDGCVELDSFGFVLADEYLPKDKWPLPDRAPLKRETSHPGVFVAGTARRGHTVQRVGTAFSDGMETASSVYEYLKLTCPTAVAA